MIAALGYWNGVEWKSSDDCYHVLLEELCLYVFRPASLCVTVHCIIKIAIRESLHHSLFDGEPIVEPRVEFTTRIGTRVKQS
jgi:hypothetical protein